jgi:hypothetical protein
MIESTQCCEVLSAAVLVLYGLLSALRYHPDNEPSYMSHIGISMHDLKLRGAVVDSIRLKIELPD